MAKIKINIPKEPFEGMLVSFRAPGSSTEAEGLFVEFEYMGNHAMQEYVFKDAHGNNLAGVDLFASGSAVSVLLCSDGAYVQNADTNKYLEGRLAYVADESWRAYNASQNALAGVYELNEKLGDIDSALDELHSYAQALIGGEA